MERNEITVVASIFGEGKQKEEQLLFLRLCFVTNRHNLNAAQCIRPPPKTYALQMIPLQTITIETLT